MASHITNHGRWIFGGMIDEYHAVTHSSIIFSTKHEMLFDCYYCEQKCIVYHDEIIHAFGGPIVWNIAMVGEVEGWEKVMCHPCFKKLSMEEKDKSGKHYLLLTQH